MNGNTPQGPARFPEEPRPTPPQSQPGGIGSFTPPNQPPRPPMPPTPPGPSGAVPPPPPAEIGVRTMSSDASSMRQSGGMQSQPKTFRPEDLASAPTFQPSAGAPAKSTRPVNKAILVIGGAAVFLIILGVVFFLFIKPLISPQTEAPTPPVSETPPPSQTSTPPAETSTPPATSQFKHQSLFNPAPTLSATITLDKLALADVTAAIQKATSDTPAAGSVKELVMASDQVGTTNFLSVVLPDLDNKFTDANFEKDFTAFAYYDVSGVWPGYVFKLKEKADLAEAKSAIAGIEKSVNLINFYLTSPGTPKATTFKDGTPVKANPVRYFTYSKAGASLNYAWLERELLISTSYGGFKEAVKLLGF